VQIIYFFIEIFCLWAFHLNNWLCELEEINVSELKGLDKGLLYFNIDEIKLLVDNIISYRDKLIVRLLYELGCSLKELVNIRIRDIDFEKSTIYITKGSQTIRAKRESLISINLANSIHKYLNNTNLANKKIAYLFQSSHGGHMTVRRVTQIITLILLNQGFKKRTNPQILKYSHVVNAYYKGVSVCSIAKQVGLTKQRLIAILLEIDEKETKQAYHTFFDED
jgi:site-specific recombinase XerD